MIRIPVHIGNLYGIVIKEGKLSNATTREHLSCNASNSSQSNNNNAEFADFLVYQKQTTNKPVSN